MVENIGVNKSIELIDSSNLVLMLIDNSRILDKEEEELLNKIKNKNHIIVVNKCDLETKVNLEDFDNVIRISALNNEGIELLKDKIKQIFNLDKIETDDMSYLSNARIMSLLNQSLKIVDEIKLSIENNTPIDMLEIDLRNLWQTLGNITGDTYEDELLDQLFSQFCLGK